MTNTIRRCIGLIPLSPLIFELPEAPAEFRGGQRLNLYVRPQISGRVGHKE